MSTKPGTTKRSQQRLLKAFRSCGKVITACEIAKVPRSRHYAWLKCDDEYTEEFRQAEDERLDRLEEEAYRRAVEGVTKLKFYHDQPLKDPVTGDYYYEREYSDRLLELLLKAAAPDKYRERSEVVSRHSGTLSVVEEIVESNEDNDGG